MKRVILILLHCKVCIKWKISCVTAIVYITDIHFTLYFTLYALRDYRIHKRCKAERNFYAASRNSREVIFEWEAAGGSDKAHSRLDNGLWQVRYCLRVEEVPLLHAIDYAEFFFNLTALYLPIFQPWSQKLEIKKNTGHTHTYKRVLFHFSLISEPGHFYVPDTHCERSRCSSIKYPWRLASEEKKEMDSFLICPRNDKIENWRRLLSIIFTC